MKDENTVYNHSVPLNILKESIVTFSTKLFIFSFAFFKSIIIARILGPSGKGIWSALVFIPSITVTFTNLGIDSANAFFTSKKTYPLNILISNSITLVAFLSFLTLFVYAILFKFIYQFYSQKYTSLSPLILWIMLINIPLILFYRFLTGILHGEKKIILINKITLAVNFIHLIILLIMLIVLKLSIKGLAYAYLITNLLSTLLTTIYLIKYGFKTFRVQLYSIKAILAYGIKCFIGNALQYLNYRADVFLLFTLKGVKSVGIYTLGVTLIEILWFFSYAVNFSLFPRIASADKKSQTFIPSAFKVTILLTLFLAIPFLFLLPFITNFLYGNKFLPSVKVGYFLFPGILLFVGYRILASFFAGIGRPGINTWINFLSLVLNIIGNIILIPYLDFIGASISSTISYSFSFVLSLFIYLKLTKEKLNKFLKIDSKDLKFLKSSILGILKIFKNKLISFYCYFITYLKRLG